MIKLKKNREYFGRDIPPELMETRKAHVSGVQVYLRTLKVAPSKENMKKSCS